MQAFRTTKAPAKLTTIRLTSRTNGIEALQEEFLTPLAQDHLPVFTKLLEARRLDHSRPVNAARDIIKVQHRVWPSPHAKCIWNRQTVDPNQVMIRHESLQSRDILRQRLIADCLNESAIKFVTPAIYD